MKSRRIVIRHPRPHKADLDVLRTLYNAAAAGRLGANFGANCTIAGQNQEIAVESDLLKPMWTRT